MNQIVGQIITYAQYAAIILSFFGDKIFAYFQMPYPGWYLKMRENKMMSFFLIYMGGNLIYGQLMQTGAFEVYLNNQIIFSKLRENRVPNIEEIFTSIERQL